MNKILNPKNIYKTTYEVWMLIEGNKKQRDTRERNPH